MIKKLSTLFAFAFILGFGIHATAGAGHASSAGTRTTRSVAPVTIYVDSSIAVSGNGTDWTTAFKTLKEAIDFANSDTRGYDIRIAKGTYYPAGSTPGNDSRVFFVLNRTGINLYGGYASGGSAEVDLVNNVVNLSGEGSPLNGGTRSAHILVLAGVDAGVTRLDGLRLIYSRSVRGQDDYPNNTYLDGVSGALVLSANSPQTVVELSRSFISGTVGHSLGAAITNDGSVLNVNNCVLSQNTFVGGPGAAKPLMSLTGGSSKFYNCTFAGNYITGSQGHLFGEPVASTAIVFENCVFDQSDAESNATSGLEVVTFTNCSASGNYAAGANVVNSTSNVASVGFISAIAPAYGEVYELGGNFDLTSSSVLVGGGSAYDSTLHGTTDILGRTRFQKGATDLGAYESSYSGPSPELFTSAITGRASSIQTIAVQVKLFNNFSTLQGNIKPGASVDSILSVRISDKLKGVSGIEQDNPTIHSNGTISYAYTATSPFSLNDNDTLFTIEVKLAENATLDTICNTPLLDSTYTYTMWGKVAPVREVIPAVNFGAICVTGVEPTITLGTFNVCPADVSVTVPFTSTGFANANGFKLFVDGSQVSATLNQAKTALIYSGNTAFGTSEHSFFISDPGRGIVSDTAIKTAAAYDAVVVKLDGQSYTSGSAYTVCPNTTIAVELSGLTNPYTISGDYSSTSATSFNLTSGDTVSIVTTNAAGCIQPVAFAITTSGIDTIAPVVTMVTGPYTVTYAENESQAVIDLSSFIASKSDNCGILSVSYSKTSDNNTSYAVEVHLEEGSYDITYSVVDVNFNVTRKNIILNVEQVPAFELSLAQAKTTNGVGNPDITFVVKAGGSNTNYAFDTISGSIDFGRFVKEKVSITPNFTYSTFTADIVNGKFTYAAGDVALNGAATLFTIVVKPGMAADTANECYTPALGTTSWITSLGTAAVVSGDFEANCLTGLAVVTGAVTDANENNWTKNTTVHCQGCLNEGNFQNDFAVTSNFNKFNFRAVPGTEVSLTFTDNSGENGINTGVNDAILNRQYVLISVEFNDNQKIAADVDNNEKVNTLDVLQQRKNALSDLPLFVNNFGQASLYSYITNTASKKVSGVVVGKTVNLFDVTVIEIGKVDQYKTFTPALGVMDELALEVPDKTVSTDQTVLVPVVAKRFSNVAGYQFTMEWNNSVLEYQSVVDAKHHAQLGETQLADGKLMLSWVENNAKNESLAANDTLFFVQYKVIGAKGAQTAININSSVTHAEAFDEKLNAKNLVVAPSTVYVVDATGLNEIGNGYAVSNAMPNPFITGTRISFNLPSKQDVTFTVYNNLGQLVSETITYNSGLNTWTLPQMDNMPAGVYTITMNGSGLKHAVKVVKN
ncbi:MAG: T9SS type A sorting domain-containing protein [Bacteroidota bacterium]